MNMRPSRVLAKLRAGQPAYSVKMNLADPRVVEIASLCGFDCVWLDMEHVPNTMQDIENQVRAAKMHNVDTIVRVERGCYSDLIRPLEMDAAAIMVPHIMSLDDARRVARATKFHPIGLRPIDGGNSDGSYCMIDTVQYMAQANRERFTCIQIEDVEPMAQLDEIAQVAGIDMLFFGPGDFSQSIGAPAQWDDPRIDQARRAVAAAARKHGKFAGTVGSPATLAGLLDMGYQFINLGADVLGLTTYFSQLVSATKKGT